MSSKCWGWTPLKSPVWVSLTTLKRKLICNFKKVDAYKVWTGAFTVIPVEFYIIQWVYKFILQFGLITPARVHQILPAPAACYYTLSHLSHGIKNLRSKTSFVDTQRNSTVAWEINRRHIVSVSENWDHHFVRVVRMLCLFLTKCWTMMSIAYAKSTLPSLPTEEGQRISTVLKAPRIHATIQKCVLPKRPHSHQVNRLDIGHFLTSYGTEY